MDKSDRTDINILSTEPLITPAQLLNKYPVTEQAAATVLSGRQQVKDILEGKDDRLIVITGPCSIHDEGLALDYTEKLVELSDQVKDELLVIMRVYFEKPRTTVGWKGLLYDPKLNDSFDIEEGLSLARSILLKVADMGMYAGTEFLDPIVPQYLADLVSWGTIGARTTESQIHRQMASGLSMPVGFKNGTDGNTQIAVDAVVSSRSPHGFLGLDKDGQTAIVKTNGNPNGHLVLRGGSTGPNYSATYVADAKKQLEGAGVTPNIIVDCSHGNSNKDHRNQGMAFKEVVSQRAGGNASVVGSMLESNINEGSQKLTENLNDLSYGVSITDACINWDETTELLLWAHEALGQSKTIKI
ncbi:MAG TPA: 3-deoxy-7-phosphoheptulonate synthase [Dehalococcoidia bacterium]|nr:3-deoxy-7-phosphoheptulonate synthase [Dehalococcoidia bacterium]